MNTLIKNDPLEIEDLIYEIRGKQVMLDSDLAKLYQCVNGTKTINLAVKRHINRFPERFMFRLTEEEARKFLRFQFETLNKSGNRTGQHLKYLPYAFTEEGVAMLATILRTKVAEEVSIRIMDAFVAMKKYISSNLLEQRYINNLVLVDHSKLELLEKSFNKLDEKKKATDIYFSGQIFDAYSKVLDICKEAKKELVIIDAYADNTLLDIIKRLKAKVTIITKCDNLLTNQDIDKYNKQYSNLSVIFNNLFHDRYFIIDSEKLYHCGTSVNRIGYKTFCINLVGDEDVFKPLLSKINRIKKDAKTI